MDDNNTRKSLPRCWWLFIVVPLAVLALVAGGVWAGMTFFADKADNAGGDGVPGYQSAMDAAMAGKAIGYATNVVTDDPETLQKAVDEMYEKADKDPGVSLEYKNTALSTDGKTFQCYIGNSEKNAYDMFFTLYADPELTDVIYLSELLRPGSRFEEITLERTLEPGDHEVYLVHTQVQDNEEDPELLQVIHAQISTVFHLVVEDSEES